MAQRNKQSEIVRRGAEVVEDASAKLAEVMFGPDGMPWGTRFSDLEQQAGELADALARRIIERCVRQQAASDVPNAMETCPACNGPLECRDAESRLLLTPHGETTWDEPQRFCLRCRRSFFPSVQKFGD